MSRRKRFVSAYIPGQPFANQAYWEAQGHSFDVQPDTPEQAAAKQAERDAVRMRNSESVREMFAAARDPDHDDAADRADDARMATYDVQHSR